jgi:hypothetical protein
LASAAGTEPKGAGEATVVAGVPPRSPLRRQVHRAALIVGGPLALILLVVCLVPHDYYTGTNSVRTRGFVQPVKAHQTLCVRGLNLPADTGRVQFDLLTTGPQTPAMSMRLTTARGTVTSRVAAQPAAPTTRHKVAFPIAQRPSEPDAVPATACVTPAHTTTFGGTVNVAGAAPTLDGRPQVARIAVWFLPPGGHERSLIAQLPDIVARAALFRPGIVGPWTYVVLLLLVLPGAGWLGLRALARADEARTSRTAGAIFLAAFLVSTSWALITPPFQAPDEQDHFAYVQHLAETGNAPRQAGKPGDQAWSQDERNALEFTRALSANEQSDGRPPWRAVNERAWERGRDAGHDRADGGGFTTSATHGPVYYGALVPAYAAARGSSIWTQLTLERITSALIGALAALFTFLAAREILPRPRVFAVAAGLLVAYQPMFTFISGAVNNDVGINAAAAATVFLLMRLLRRGAAPWLVGALGVLLGLLPVIKGTGYELYPIAAIAALGALLRFRDRRTVLGIALFVASGLVVQVVWSQVAPSFGHTTFTTPGGGAPTSASALSTPGLYASYVWQIFLPKLPFMHDHFVQTWPFFNIYVERAWASFGWYTIVFPRYVYGLIVLAMAGAIVLGLVAMRREWPWVRTRIWELLVLALLPAAVIAGVESAFATQLPRPVLAEMGRYLFPAISALAILAVGATIGVGRRRAASLATGVVAAEFVLLYASQLLELRGFYT